MDSRTCISFAYSNGYKRTLSGWGRVRTHLGPHMSHILTVLSALQLARAVRTMLFQARPRTASLWPSPESPLAPLSPPPYPWQKNINFGIYFHFLYLFLLFALSRGFHGKIKSRRTQGQNWFQSVDQVQVPYFDTWRHHPHHKVTTCMCHKTRQVKLRQLNGEVFRNMSK